MTQPAQQLGVDGLEGDLVAFGGCGSHEVAVRAVHLLNDLVRGVATAPVVEIMPVELVIRDSCGAMRAVAGAEIQ